MNPTPAPAISLRDKIRDTKYQGRLDQAQVIAAWPDKAERAETAKAIIREIGMGQVFDRFTKEQEENLLDALWPLAHPEITLDQPLFGDGAYNKIDRKR